MYSQELREEVSEEEEDGGAMLGQQLPSSEGQCQMVADNPGSMHKRTGWKLPRPTCFTSAIPTSHTSLSSHRALPDIYLGLRCHIIKKGVSLNQLVNIDPDWIISVWIQWCPLNMSARIRQPPTVAVSLKR